MSGRDVRRIILTGAGGLLGGAFREALAGQSVIAVGRGQLDADAPDILAKIVGDSAGDLVINCAAHTDVEAAERDPAADFKVNGRLPGVIGEICKNYGATLVHFSSTGCYGEWKSMTSGQRRRIIGQSLLARKRSETAAVGISYCEPVGFTAARRISRRTSCGKGWSRLARPT
jgi:nucleoside-diphosphate-sugar epimerase